MRIFVVLMLLGFAFLPKAFAEEDLDEWLGKNNPIVKKFLLNLSAQDKNRPLSGLRLSDGKEILKGAVLLDIVHIAKWKQHIYVFKNRRGMRDAYLFVEKDGFALDFPRNCFDGIPPNARVLSGDSNTWPYADPDGDVVILYNCVTDEWLAGLKSEVK